MGKSPKAPPPPDYKGLAEQQATINQQVNQEQTVANRPTQVNPYGQLQWKQDPETGQWTQTETWDPRIQQLTDQQIAQQGKQQGNIAGLLASQGQGLNAPQAQGFQQQDLGMGQFSSDVLKNLPKYDPATGEAFSKRFSESLLARVRPEQAEAKSQMETKLRLQGLQPGTEAYNRAYQNLLTSQGDVNAQAQLQGMLAGAGEARSVYGTQLEGALARAAEERNLYGTQLGSALQRSQDRQSQYATGSAGQQQQFQQAMQKYLLPYQTAQATQGLISDSAGQFRPTYQGFSGSNSYQGADMMGAAQQQYAQQVQRANEAAARKTQTGQAIGTVVGAAAGMFVGAPMVGAAAGGAVGSAFSDPALKEEIEVISDKDAYYAMLLVQPHSFTWPSGLRATGLLADEVAKVFPHLVHPAEQGYLKVDYEAFTALLLGAFRYLARRNENGPLQ
jgi:hypothetical protein